MRIFLDMDEVIVSWLQTVLDWYNEDKGSSYTRADITEWDVVSCLPNSRDFLRSLCRYPEFYRDLAPVAGSIEGVRMLLALGHDVIIATAVPKFAGVAYHGKLEWIRRNMPFFNLKNLVSIQRKDLLCHGPSDILFDDGPHNLESWSRAGGRAVAMEHPWNRGWNGERVSTWSDFVDLVTKES